MRRAFLTALVLSVPLLQGVCGAAPTARVTSGQAGERRQVRTFLDETLAIVQRFMNTTTTLAANVSLRRRATGLTDFVNADCRVFYRAPGYLEMDVKGLHPYSVLISNGVVRTEFKETCEVDTRALAANENIFEDFLGISSFPDKRKYRFSFRTEGNLYIITATLRPQFRMAFAREILKNAHKAAQRIMWVDPIAARVVKTQVKTLGGGDSTYTYRAQWINMPVPAY